MAKRAKDNLTNCPLCNQAGLPVCIHEGVSGESSGEAEHSILIAPADVDHDEIAEEFDAYKPSTLHLALRPKFINNPLKRTINRLLQRFAEELNINPDGLSLTELAEKIGIQIENSGGVILISMMSPLHTYRLSELLESKNLVTIPLLLKRELEKRRQQGMPESSSSNTKSLFHPTPFSMKPNPYR